MLVFFLILSLFLLIIISLVAFVFIKRTIQFDNLFSIIIDDIDDNVSYLENLLSKSLLSNAPEIVELTRKNKHMRDRFELISNIIKNNKKSNIKKVNPRPPVVVD